MKNYPFTWLKNKQNSKADTEGNPTDVSQVDIPGLFEYKEYINSWLYWNFGHNSSSVLSRISNYVLGTILEFYQIFRVKLKDQTENVINS
jgi:hypothetical protein